MSRKDFRAQHKIKLQGKEYLPVAARVVEFRADHPTWAIVTKPTELGGDVYMHCTVMDEEGRVMATAHKRVRQNAKGPAGQWPLETAETGAMGRALAMCGYGTLAGDLDEGDELADAPVESKVIEMQRPPKQGTDLDIGGMIDLATSARELAAVVDAIKKLPNGERAKWRAAYAAKRDEVMKLDGGAA